MDLSTYQAYYTHLASGYARDLHAAMEAGEIRSMDPEALAYALIGIGHFLALRFLIWPDKESNPSRPAAINSSQNTGDTPEMSERVIATLLDFITRGLQP